MPCKSATVYTTGRTFSLCNKKKYNYQRDPLPDINPETNGTQEVKINGYVDDTQFFVLTEESVVESFCILKRYENASGAKVNKNKTFGLYTGA